MLLTDAQKRLNCTDSPWARCDIYMCCCSPMQRNVSTAPIHHKHTAKFTCVAAHRCKDTSTVQLHCRRTAKFTCDAAHRCKETSQLYRFTMGTLRHLHVLLLTDAKTRRLYSFTVGAPRNLHVMLLTDAKKRLNCTDSPWARCDIYMCCCSPMQRTSRMYGLTIGTPAGQRPSKTRFP